MAKKTKKDWYDHIQRVIEVTNLCKSKKANCSECVKVIGPCFKNIEINKFAQLIELADLPDK